MAKIRITTPLYFRSKLLCFSLFYLFTCIIVALYTSLSSSKCIFRYSPFDPIQYPLFSYPSTYGEHKYAIPTSRSSCSFPVYFSDYWLVLKEIKEFCRNTSSPLVKYIRQEADSFGGNFSSQLRFSYLDHLNDRVAVPCGFMKKFPVSDIDRVAMENCKGVVVVSTIFDDHDKIRQPIGLGSKTLDSVCFFMFIDDTTFRGLNYHKLVLGKSKDHRIGAWRLVKVLNQDLYQNAALNGMIPKYLVHRLFPNSKYSIWLDAKLQLMIDPLLLIHSLVISEGVDMAISKHPYFTHAIEEAMATARWNKWWDIISLRRQMETYCEHGLEPWSFKKLPYVSDVPDSAMILRKHGLATNLFSCLVFNELEAFNPRDQLAFAFVRDSMNPKLKLNMFEAEVFEQVVMEYRHNLNRHKLVPTSKNTKTKWAKPATTNNSARGRCDRYLQHMWGETHT